MAGAQLHNLLQGLTPPPEDEAPVFKPLLANKSAHNGRGDFGGGVSPMGPKLGDSHPADSLPQDAEFKGPKNQLFAKNFTFISRRDPSLFNVPYASDLRPSQGSIPRGPAGVNMVKPVIPRNSGKGGLVSSPYGF